MPSQEEITLYFDMQIMYFDIQNISPIFPLNTPSKHQ